MIVLMHPIVLSTTEYLYNSLIWSIYVHLLHRHLLCLTNSADSAYRLHSVLSHFGELMGTTWRRTKP